MKVLLSDGPFCGTVYDGVTRPSICFPRGNFGGPGPDFVSETYRENDPPIFTGDGLTVYSWVPSGIAYEWAMFEGGELDGLSADVSTDETSLFFLVSGVGAGRAFGERLSEEQAKKRKGRGKGKDPAISLYRRTKRADKEGRPVFEWAGVDASGEDVASG